MSSSSVRAQWHLGANYYFQECGLMKARFSLINHIWYGMDGYKPWGRELKGEFLRWIN